MSKFMSSLEERLKDPEFRAGYEESKEQLERGPQMNPVERAAEALWNRMLDGLPETSRSEWRPWNNEAVGAIDWHHDARAVFDSIDTDELRDLISGWPIGSGYYGTQIGTDEAYDIALAVKNWLIGKEPQ